MPSRVASVSAPPYLTPSMPIGVGDAGTGVAVGEGVVFSGADVGVGGGAGNGVDVGAGEGSGGKGVLVGVGSAGEEPEHATARTAIKSKRKIAKRNCRKAASFKVRRARLYRAQTYASD